MLQREVDRRVAAAEGAEAVDTVLKGLVEARGRVAEA